MKKIIKFCLVTVLALTCTACNNNSKEAVTNTSENPSAVLLKNGERFYDVSSFINTGDETAQEYVVKELSYVTTTAKIVDPLELNVVAVEGKDQDTKLRIQLPDGMNIFAVNEEGTEKVPVVYMKSVDTGDAWIAEVEVDITSSVSLWAFKPSGGEMNTEIEVHPVLV